MELQRLQPQEGSSSHANLPFLEHDPFRDPGSAPSRPMSMKAPSIAESVRSVHPKIVRKFQSSRLIGEYQKPWLENRDPRMKWDRILFWSFALVGIGIAAYICYSGWASVETQQYCLQFEDDFSSGINLANWGYDIQLDGFGTGSFDWTTADPKNSYTDAEGLHIVPTLTIETTDITEAQLLDGHAVNLTIDGTCTSPDWQKCSALSNKTEERIINPVRSARLTTRGKQTLRYGKIEVVAKLPRGDWLWPAIWMMPQDSTYGIWPRSGEIDIMESKGNDRGSAAGGRESVSGALHWGPITELDMFEKTVGTTKLKRKDFTDDFHVFGLEWSPTYINVYTDMILKQSLYVPFGKKYGDMYYRGGFGSMDFHGNGPPANPWGLSSNPNAPFDQEFYLILNLAVGGTSGYFQDGLGGKPWADKVNGTALQFWKARHAWEPTWGQGDTRGLTVKSVKMWRAC